MVSAPGGLFYKHRYGRGCCPRLAPRWLAGQLRWPGAFRVLLERAGFGNRQPRFYVSLGEGRVWRGIRIRAAAGALRICPAASLQKSGFRAPFAGRADDNGESVDLPDPGVLICPNPGSFQTDEKLYPVSASGPLLFGSRPGGPIALSISARVRPRLPGCERRWSLRAFPARRRRSLREGAFMGLMGMPVARTATRVAPPLAAGAQPAKMAGTTGFSPATTPPTRGFLPHCVGLPLEVGPRANKKLRENVRRISLGGGPRLGEGSPLAPPRERFPGCYEQPGV